VPWQGIVSTAVSEKKKQQELFLLVFHFRSKGIEEDIF
jgi:hypothetical protein